MTEEEKDINQLIGNLKSEIDGSTLLLLEPIDIPLWSVIIFFSDGERYIGIVVANQNSLICLETPCQAKGPLRFDYAAIHKLQLLYQPENHTEVFQLRKLVERIAERIEDRVSITNASNEFYNEFKKWSFKKTAPPNFFQRLFS